MANGDNGDDLLILIERLLTIQLRAVQRLRRRQMLRPKPAPQTPSTLHKSPRITQMDLAYEVLVAAGGPLYLREIAARIQEQYGATVGFSALASHLLRKAKQRSRFVKTGPNTYGLLGRDKPC